MKFYLGIILFFCTGLKTAAQADPIRVNQVVDTLFSQMDTLYLGNSKKVDSSSFVPKTTETAKKIKGIASFYSKNLDGTQTATGEVFNNRRLTAVSNHVKLNTWVRVTNLSNGKTVIVRINDRMHPKMAKRGRVIDLSRAAARELDFMKKGLTKVQIERITAKTVN